MTLAAVWWCATFADAGDVLSPKTLRATTRLVTARRTGLRFMVAPSVRPARPSRWTTAGLGNRVTCVPRVPKFDDLPRLEASAGNMCLMSPELAHHLTSMDPAVLGARIKAARVAVGLTQPELAGTDASVAYLSRIESGQRRPNVDLLTSLAGKLGVT